jgi:Na+-translocating ferredoxin:NAD+ oxidoreductase RnfC subunit
LEAQLNALITIGFLVLTVTAPIAGLPAQGNIVLAQGADCYSIGEQQAVQLGGTLANANDAVRNGQPVCRVIVVVPGQNGERPKRVEIIVPKG